MSGHCSHVIGLLKSLQGFKLHGFTNIPDVQSCTSIPQQWNVPRGNKIQPIPINHVVVARPRETRKRKPVLCQVDGNTSLPKLTASDFTTLQNLKGTPLEYLVKPDASQVSSSLGDVQLGSYLSYQTQNLKSQQAVEPSTSVGCSPLILPQTSPVKLPEKFQQLNNGYVVDNPQNLEILTRTQSESDLWKDSRRARLTSSNFGKIMKRKRPVTDAFLKSVFPDTEVHAPSLDYGKRNESVAKVKYLEINKSVHMHECGLVVNNEFSFLGATPDAKLSSGDGHGIAEIKCPYSARNVTIREACVEIPDFYLKLQDDEPKLDKTVKYYDQIQGQFMITGAAFCEFIVYTQKDLHAECIQPDVQHMLKMLPKLCQFFKIHATAYLGMKGN